MQRDRVGTAKGGFVAVLNSKHHADSLFFRQPSRFFVAIFGDIERSADRFAASFCSGGFHVVLNLHLNSGNPSTFFIMISRLHVIDARQIAAIGAVLAHLHAHIPVCQRRYDAQDRISVSLGDGQRLLIATIGAVTEGHLKRLAATRKINVPGILTVAIGINPVDRVQVVFVELRCCLGDFGWM